MSAPRGALFDLDGTLIDSRADIADSVNRSLVDHGAAPLPRERILGFVGRGVAHLLERCTEAADPALDPERVGARFLEHYREHLLDETRPYPGVPALLEAARAAGLATAVVSNKPEGFVRPIVEGLGLGPFEVVLGGDSTERRKPHPLPMRTALERLRLEHDECVYVGDSPVDVDAARAVQLPFVGVTYGLTSRERMLEAGATHLVDAAHELAVHLGLPSLDGGSP